MNKWAYIAAIFAISLAFSFWEYPGGDFASVAGFATGIALIPTALTIALKRDAQSDLRNYLWSTIAFAVIVAVLAAGS